MGLWWNNDSGQNTLRGEPAYEAADGAVFRNHIEAEHYSSATGLSYSVWLDDNGNPGDPGNPIHLSNDFILHCIHTVPQARADFYKILPTLNQAEQDRLNRMLEGAPYVQTPQEDAHTRTDRFTHRFNTAGVRTGRYGGTRRG
jgi:hypothetical protein